MLSLLNDQYLLALFQSPGWDLRANLPHWVCLVVPEWQDCCYVAKHFAEALSGGVPVYFEYGGSARHVCQLSTKGKIMDISIGGAVTINRSLLDVFGEMLSSPQRSLGLVRLRDERQLSVSGGADGQFMFGKTVEQAEKLHRADYWHPEDLADFNRDWQQAMSIGGGWHERSYRSFDPMAPSYRRGPEYCEQRFTTRYKLVEGPKGELFHYCENLAVEAIA